MQLARDSYHRQAAAIQLSIAQRHLRSKQFLREYFATGRATIPEGFGVPVPRPPRATFPDESAPRAPPVLPPDPPPPPMPPDPHDPQGSL
jgi:hypothetical protein